MPPDRSQHNRSPKELADEVTGEFPINWDDPSLHVRRPQQEVTLNLDPDVIRYFKSFGTDYEARINWVLRSYLRDRDHRRAERDSGKAPKSGE